MMGACRGTPAFVVACGAAVSPVKTSPSTRSSEYLTEDDTLVWVDMFDPDHAGLSDLATELGLNIWAVEDAVAASSG